MIKSTVLSLLVGVCPWCAAWSAPAPHTLRCEWAARPLNVDRRAPRLSWQSDLNEQRAWQIQVASSDALVHNDNPDLWDSGRVASPHSLSIAYQGRPLRSRQACFWRVRLWGAGDEPGAWSDAAAWEMGLLTAGDWTAQWIRATNLTPADEGPALTRWLALAGHTEDKEGHGRTTGAKRLREVLPASLFRKSFEVTKPVAKARLYSAAAGYIELFLDGARISKRVMNPAQTDFEKRILYDVDAVEDRLPRGRHTLTAHLGEGFYGQGVAFRPQFRYGDPAVIIQLEITCTDGSTRIIATDASWHARPSPVIKNNIYAGEVHDARLEAEPIADWTPAAATTSPTAKLEAQLVPPVTMVREMRPEQILQPRPGVWVFDFGQNFTGVPTLHLAKPGFPPGTAVFLRYAEWADEKGRINQASDGAFATMVHQADCYISSGADDETWTPSFTWHGFRYVEVTGLPDGFKPGINLLSAHLVRSGVRRRGRFECSDPHLNRVHETALWSYESNLVSIPSDCPIRERCGWTGDAHATLTMSNANFDMAAFWEKFLDDFRTSRHASPAIVPGRRGGNSNPDWAVAQVLVAWEHYLNFADVQTLRAHYPRLQSFMRHFRSKQKDGIVEAGYGDWCDPVRTPGTPRVGGAGKPQQTPPAITSTALFIHAADLMGHIARVLDDEGGSARYRSWKDQSAKAFHARFFDAGRATYGSQTADAMALSFGLVPPGLRAAVANSLHRDVVENWNGHASVGALGHRWLYPALADAGYADTAFGTFHARGHPGFHYLFDDLRGTTLWERKGAFNPATMEAPERSLNHPFQGGYDAWFFHGLGGIRPDPEHPGYKHIILQPVFPAELDWVKADLEAPYGMITSHWRRQEGKITWDVTIPPNTTATVRIPADRKPRTVGPGAHRFSLDQPVRGPEPRAKSRAK